MRGGRGVREQQPFPTPGWARRPPSGAGARRGARSRVPSDARQDTKGWRESTESGCASGAAGGPERPGADCRAGVGLAGTARWGAGWGVVRPSCPSLRPPSTAVTASRAEVGAQGAGAALAVAVRPAGRLHFPSRALMAAAGLLFLRAERGLTSEDARGLLHEFFLPSARFSAEARRSSSLESFSDVIAIVFRKRKADLSAKCYVVCILLLEIRNVVLGEE